MSAELTGDWSSRPPSLTPSSSAWQTCTADLMDSLRIIIRGGRWIPFHTIGHRRCQDSDDAEAWQTRFMAHEPPFSALENACTSPDVPSMVGGDERGGGKIPFKCLLKQSDLKPDLSVATQLGISSKERLSANCPRPPPLKLATETIKASGPLCGGSWM
ncbi:hypothetical protein BaRGS_00001146 [Batillaria attramentaria]|uniref:Uncharacterized protein n=1 Tax=Batillaria attramentaria TaxID=370345 RepID=A0ABD0M776_9CAEN